MLAEYFSEMIEFICCGNEKAYMIKFCSNQNTNLCFAFSVFLQSRKLLKMH